MRTTCLVLALITFTSPARHRPNSARETARCKRRFRHPAPGPVTIIRPSVGDMRSSFQQRGPYQHGKFYRIGEWRLNPTRPYRTRRTRRSYDGTVSQKTRVSFSEILRQSNAAILARFKMRPHRT